MIDLISNELAMICPDPVIGINRQGIISLFNPAAEKLLGYSAIEVLGQFQIGHLYHPPESSKEIKQLIYSDELGGPGQIQQHEANLITKNGDIVPIKLSATLLMEGDTEVGSIGFFHNMSAQKEFEQSLKDLAITDSLTGLYNQRHFHTILSQEVARSKRHNHPLSLICIDLDNFKGVNDSLGHLEGDNLLRYVGELMSHIARTNDLSFRYGGDEFMLLLPETTEDMALSVAKRLIKEYEHRQLPLLRSYNEGPNPVSLSVGVSQFSQNESPELFVKRADLAMYQAKKSTGSYIESSN